MSNSNPLTSQLPRSHSVSIGPAVSHASSGVSTHMSPNRPTTTQHSPSRGVTKVDVAYERHLSDTRLKQLEADPKLFTGLTPAQKDLLEYYHYRVSTFDAERADLLAKVATLESTREAYYQLKWDLTKRDEQISELQKALSDAHVFLFQERDQVLKLAAENDELRVQELEDRKRIQHLLALTQPVSQEVTYFKDCRPGKATRNYAPIDKITGKAKAKGGVARPATAGTSRATPLPSAGTGVSAGKGRGNGVVRTIYMPNENVDVLRLIIQSLRTQLAEQKTFHEQRCQALTEDRVIRESEHAEAMGKMRSSIEGLQRDLAQLMDTHKETTKDYLNLRHELVTKERDLREQCAKLSQEVAAGRKLLEKSRKEWAEREIALQREGEVFVDMFRKQALGSEEDLAIVRGQYEAAQQLYEKKIKHLEAKLQQAAQKLKQVEERRRLEMQGYQADVRTCKDRLKALERAVAGIKVVDGDGVASVPPKVVKLLAHNKDFNDIKYHIADIAHRLDKGYPLTSLGLLKTQRNIMFAPSSLLTAAMFLYDRSSKVKNAANEVTKLVDAPQVNHASVLTPLAAFIAPASGLFHHFLAYNHIDTRYRHMRLAKLPRFSELPEEDMSLFPSTAGIAPTPILSRASPNTEPSQYIQRPFDGERLLSHTISSESLGRMYDGLTEDEFRTLMTHVARLCERVDGLQQVLRTSLAALLFAEGTSHHAFVAALLDTHTPHPHHAPYARHSEAADALVAVDRLLGSSVLSSALGRARWVCHEAHFLLFDVMGAGTHPKVVLRAHNDHTHALSEGLGQGRGHSDGEDGDARARVGSVPEFLTGTGEHVSVLQEYVPVPDAYEISRQRQLFHDDTHVREVARAETERLRQRLHAPHSLAATAPLPGEMPHSPDESEYEIPDNDFPDEIDAFVPLCEGDWVLEDATAARQVPHHSPAMGPTPAAHTHTHMVSASPSVAAVEGYSPSSRALPGPGMPPAPAHAHARTQSQSQLHSQAAYARSQPSAHALRVPQHHNQHTQQPLRSTQQSTRASASAYGSAAHRHAAETAAAASLGYPAAHMHAHGHTHANTPSSEERQQTRPSLPLPLLLSTLAALAEHAQEALASLQAALNGALLTTLLSQNRPRAMRHAPPRVLPSSQASVKTHNAHAVLVPNTSHSFATDMAATRASMPGAAASFVRASLLLHSTASVQGRIAQMEVACLYAVVGDDVPAAHSDTAESVDRGVATAAKSPATGVNAARNRVCDSLREDSWAILFPRAQAAVTHELLPGTALYRHVFPPPAPPARSGAALDAQTRSTAPSRSPSRPASPRSRARATSAAARGVASTNGSPLLSALPSAATGTDASSNGNGSGFVLGAAAWGSGGAGSRDTSPLMRPAAAPTTPNGFLTRPQALGGAPNLQLSDSRGRGLTAAGTTNTHAQVIHAQQQRPSLASSSNAAPPPSASAPPLPMATGAALAHGYWLTLRSTDAETGVDSGARTAASTCDGGGSLGSGWPVHRSAGASTGTARAGDGAATGWRGESHNTRAAFDDDVLFVDADMARVYATSTSTSTARTHTQMRSSTHSSASLPFPSASASPATPAGPAASASHQEPPRTLLVPAHAVTARVSLPLAPQLAPSVCWVGADQRVRMHVPAPLAEPRRGSFDSAADADAWSSSPLHADCTDASAACTLDASQVYGLTLPRGLRADWVLVYALPLSSGLLSEELRRATGTTHARTGYLLLGLLPLTSAALAHERPQHMHPRLDPTVLSDFCGVCRLAAFENAMGALLPNAQHVSLSLDRHTGASNSASGGAVAGMGMLPFTTPFFHVSCSDEEVASVMSGAGDHLDRLHLLQPYDGPEAAMEGAVMGKGDVAVQESAGGGVGGVGCTGAPAADAEEEKAVVADTLTEHARPVAEPSLSPMAMENTPSLQAAHALALAERDSELAARDAELERLRAALAVLEAEAEARHVRAEAVKATAMEEVNANARADALAATMKAQLQAGQEAAMSMQRAMQEQLLALATQMSAAAETQRQLAELQAVVHTQAATIAQQQRLLAEQADALARSHTTNNPPCFSVAGVASTVDQRCEKSGDSLAHANDIIIAGAVLGMTSHCALTVENTSAATSTAAAATTASNRVGIERSASATDGPELSVPAVPAVDTYTTTAFAASAPVTPAASTATPVVFSREPSAAPATPAPASPCSDIAASPAASSGDSAATASTSSRLAAVTVSTPSSAGSDTTMSLSSADTASTVLATAASAASERASASPATTIAVTVSTSSHSSHSSKSSSKKKAGKRK